MSETTTTETATTMGRPMRTTRRRKLSYDDLVTERERLDLRAFALGLAFVEMPDDCYRHLSPDRDRYNWRLYGGTRACGGYLIGTMLSAGATDARKYVYYVEYLDTAIRQVRERYSSFADCGMAAAVERFQRTRDTLNAAA